MKKIVVLGGGPSSEREVSLRSAKTVMSALTEAGFSAVFADPKDDKSYLKSSDTIIFPILHGEYGEDGVLQKQLEDRNLPFLGSGSLSSRKCFDKWVTIEFLKHHGIEVPESDFIGLDEYADHWLAGKPHVLKIIDGGSSIGTHIIREAPISAERAKKIFPGGKMIIEELIEGVELTVPILDKQSLPVIEIHPPEGSEFDYENKYNGATRELCPPVSVDVLKQKEVQRIAEQVHIVMGCRHFSRVDFMLDKEGKPYVLEINTIPGMTDQSLYPKSARQAGISMPELMRKFYNLVARDYSLE